MAPHRHHRRDGYLTAVRWTITLSVAITIACLLALGYYLGLAFISS